MSAIDETGVVRRLEAAAANATWPATPDVRAAVLARLPAGDADGASPVPAMRDLRPGVLERIRGRRAGRGRLLRPVLLGLALLLALAGIAAGLGFRLPGVVIERIPQTPAAGSGLDLGSPIPLEAALRTTTPRVLLPSALPAPDGAWVLGAGDRTIVSLAWRATDDEPTLPGSDLALTLMAVPGSVDEELLRKLAGPDTRITAVDVGGDRGWWLSGAPHEILITRPAGDVGVLRAALAGDTLLFERDGTLYRMESALGEEATLAIARSMP